MTARVSTGLPRLDTMLGGGLLPGTLTVVYGATGIGKTHLGLTFADHGRAADGARGVVLDMNGRIRGVEGLLRRVLGEQVTLITQLDEDLGRVRIDPAQLDQVLVNLCANARDAMESGGTLTLPRAPHEPAVVFVLEGSVRLADVHVPAGGTALVAAAAGDVAAQAQAHARLAVMTTGV